MTTAGGRFIRRSALALAAVVPAAAVVAATSARAADTPEAAAAPTTVTLTPARPKLLLGTDAEVTVALDVRGPESGSFVPVRALANVGTLETIAALRSEEHTSELQSRSTISYAVFCLKKKKQKY